MGMDATRMAGLRWLVGIATVALLSGCGAGLNGPGRNGSAGDGPDRLRQQAIEALARFDKAVLDAGGAQIFVPVGELTGQIGDWESTNFDNKLTLMSGLLVAATPDPDNAPGGLAIQSATTVRSSRRLTVTFVGAPSPASQPCGIDYSAEAVESANAIVVIISEHPYASDEACLGVGAYRTTTVDLAAPLEDRAVLEAVQGLPIPVTTTA